MQSSTFKFRTLDLLTVCPSTEVGSIKAPQLVAQLAVHDQQVGLIGQPVGMRTSTKGVQELKQMWTNADKMEVVQSGSIFWKPFMDNTQLLLYKVGFAPKLNLL